MKHHIEVVPYNPAWPEIFKADVECQKQGYDKEIIELIDKWLKIQGIHIIR